MPVTSGEGLIHLQSKRVSYKVFFCIWCEFVFEDKGFKFYFLICVLFCCIR